MEGSRRRFSSREGDEAAWGGRRRERHDAVEPVVTVEAAEDPPMGRREWISRGGRNGAYGDRADVRARR